MSKVYFKSLKSKYHNMFFLFLILTSCTNVKVSQHHIKYYSDLDVVNRRGIKELNKLEMKNFELKGNRIYMFFYSNNTLDSIVVENPFPKAVKMSLTVTYNNTVNIYETTYPYYGYNRKYKSYYVVKSSGATRYIELEDGWDIKMIKTDAAFEGMKTISEKNSSNFRLRLLGNEEIKLDPMPAHITKSCKIRFDKDFTFNTWLNDIK